MPGKPNPEAPCRLGCGSRIPGWASPWKCRMRRGRRNTGLTRSRRQRQTCVQEGRVGAGRGSATVRLPVRDASWNCESEGGRGSRLPAGGPGRLAPCRLAPQGGPESWGLRHHRMGHTAGVLTPSCPLWGSLRAQGMDSGAWGRRACSRLPTCWSSNWMVDEPVLRAASLQGPSESEPSPVGGQGLTIRPLPPSCLYPAQTQPSLHHACLC